MSKPTCEHKDCNEELDHPKDEYCEEHYQHYYCECGQRLEDSYGTPGDGLCRKCD